jgi:ribosomal protein S18 acetylase RimI-like enzyme
MMLLFLLVLLFNITGCIVIADAFSATSSLSSSSSITNTNTKSIIDIDVVKTQSDIIALADLRYNEWISIDDYENDYNKNNCNNNNNNSNNNHNTIIEKQNENEQQQRRPLSQPSRYAFRMATKEIYEERSIDGSIVFLARLVVDNDDSISALQKSVVVGEVVGSAELSPIEFNNTNRATTMINHLNEDENEDEEKQHKYLYATDVVTSSKHRRMGIANSLMDTLEQYAYNNEEQEYNDINNNSNKTTVTLFLHVKVDNDVAYTFYTNSRRGYCIPTPNQIQNINITQLEENSGVVSASSGGGQQQILLCKVLTAEDESASFIKKKEQQRIGSSKTVITSSTSAIGFSSSSSSSQQKKKKPKTKRKKK